MSYDEAAAEQAIRRYMQWLEDPESIVDNAAIEEAEQEARRTTDVLEKLKALSRVERLRTGDEAAVKQAFLEHARPGRARTTSARPRGSASAFHRRCCARRGSP